MCYSLLKATQKNNELLLQGKIRAEPVPTVLPSLHPAPDIRSRVNPPSVQVPPKHTHHTFKNILCKIFKSCGPTSDLLAYYDPQEPTSVTRLL
jgi:hypothetical protein